MQPETISVKITFLEPYRMVDWNECDIKERRRRTMRGQNYARRKSDQYRGLPFITGTMVRSAAIKAAEELLSLNNGIWKGARCCPGEFFAGKGKEKPVFLRKRHTLQWKNNNTPCDANNKCPYCIILGRYDNAGKDHKNNNNAWDENDHDIHFSNFSPPPEYRNKGLRLKDFTIERTLNRVDFDTGKAQDYFRTFEVDYEILPEHTGTITLNNPCENAKKLLLDSLRFIDKLCGALCTIEVKETEESTPHSHEEQTDTQAPEEDAAPKDDPAILLNEWAKKMATAFKDADKQEKVRTLADAVRSLRCYNSDILDKLPKGKKDRDKGHYTGYPSTPPGMTCREEKDNEHHLWDIMVEKKKTARAVLKELWEMYKGKNNDWRRFTETLGNCLYFAYKEESGGIPVRYRILGEAEYYPDMPESAQEKVADTFIPATPPANNPIKEWIITGRLKAVSPFYFGSFDSAQGDTNNANTEREKNANDQTSFRILLDRKNRYRIPRSVLRGVLRRDLRIAFGTGCDVELGRQVPCNCKVCTEMRKITLMDSVSDFSEPPEIRYRIERNPCTGTVEEGSLFDMEVGPEGITFPFVLRYRGTEFPKELASVIRYWQGDKMAWLGGFGSIGKGRFALVDVKAFEWILKGNDNDKVKGISPYIEKKGMRGKEFDLSGEVMSSSGYLIDFTSLEELSNHESYHDNLKPLWTEVSYTIEIGSPLLTADTIAALTDSGNRDSIAYRKRVYIDGKTEPEKRFAVKAETHRGMFRTAIGRRADDDDLVKDNHEDCSGVLCSIFGNEHEASSIRFDDLEVVNEDISEKHIDHVAIDRFNGGAVDKKKFDTYPLAGSPGKPLKLQGTFWIKKGLSDDYKKMIAAALSDIRDGLYPLGGRGGAGYGWVTKLDPDGVPKEIKDAMRNSTPYTTESTSPASYEFHKVNVPERKPDHYYFPYIFLHPHSTVKREKNMVGHEQFHDNLISGKIVCSLETLTPLIIPYTGKAGENTGDEHMRYDFFSINGETMISGSEIGGVVSTIYESLTNSCFRIFEEERYISRRPKAGEENVIPGIVKEENGNFKIITTWETIKKKKEYKKLYFYRLPLYDDAKITNAIPFDESKEKFEKRKQEIKDAMEWNEEIAKIAEKNCTFLNDPCRVAEKEDILQGKQKVCFRLEKGKNPSDYLAYLTDEKPDGRDVWEGYVKFTGQNTVQINKNSTLEFKKDEYDRFLKDYFEKAQITVTKKGNAVSVDLSGIGEEKLKTLETVFNDIVTGDVYSLNSRHNTYEWRSSQKKEYPRPRLWFIKNGVQYTIPKRCERVFLVSSNKNTTTKKYEIPDKVKRQYNSILEDYEKNFDHIEEKFRTKTQNEKLSDGDLVYFIPDANDTRAAAVFPVPLSRKADDETLGGRLPYPSLIPCVKEKAVDIPAEAAKYLDSKVLQLHNEGVCPACRLFGTTFYKGRVRFGFAKLENNAAWYSENNGGDGYLTIPLLERPRTTWPLPENKSKIPGRKFYCHHHGWKDIKGEKQTKNNCSVKALDKGNRFSFEIYFENLHPWELGVLLYSLELEQKNNLAHKIGKAKAFGFGSVRMTAENILEMDKEGNWTNSNQKKKDWLEAGFKKMEEWFCQGGQKWHETEHLKNLRTILRFPKEDEQTWKHQYPKLKKENKNDMGERQGYIELKEMLAGTLPDIKKRFFTEPGFPWHPFPAEDDKKGYRKDKKATAREHGIVKSIDKKKGFINIAKNDGSNIQGNIDGVKHPYKLAQGKHVQFTVDKGLFGTLAQDIEIID